MNFRCTSDEIEVVFGTLKKTKEVYIIQNAAKDLSYPPMDTVIKNGELHIWVDVPGVRTEDINVYIRGDLLVIEGVKRAYYPAREVRSFLRVERQNRPFRRVYRVIRPLSYDSITSALQDGVLSISWKLN